MVASESEGDGGGDGGPVDASESSDSGSDESYDLLAPGPGLRLATFIQLINDLQLYPVHDPMQASTSGSRVSERKHEEIDESIRAELDPIVG